MPKPTKGARLGGSPAHQRLMLANLATSLFTHGRITTTEAKAKRLRPFAEKLVTHAKHGDLHHRREVMKIIRDKDVVHTLFADIGPFFADRDGGYTRIIKTVPRKGDNAPMAIIELLQDKTVTDEANRARRVDTSKVVEGWIIKDDKRAQRLDKAALAAAMFEVSPQAEGKVLVAKQPANAIALHTRALKPEDLPVIGPDEDAKVDWPKGVSN